MSPETIQVLVYVGLIVIIGLRMLRERAIRVGARMWIIPALFLIVTVLPISHDGLTTPTDLTGFFVAIAAGVGIGWWLSTHSDIRADKTRGLLFVKASPWGILIYVAAFIARAVVRLLATDVGSAAVAALWSTIALFFAVGVLFGMRLHWQREYGQAPATPPTQAQ
jgi:hypothetical protein